MDCNREQAPAKLNLFLHIIGRRSDGYHLLQSVVIFVDLADQLTIDDGGGLSVDGAFAHSLGGDHRNNLVLKAADAAASVFHRKLPLGWRLTKNIPIQAGLGGGSADAAACLRLLARYWQIDITHPHWQQLATELGADVPMCLASQPAFIEGVGEEITPLLLEQEWHVVLIWPGKGLSTPAIFAQYCAHKEKMLAPYTPPITLPPLKTREDFLLWLHTTQNDLTPAAMAIFPFMTEILTALQQAVGCYFARMSGSGSACFGLFSSPATAEAAAQLLQKHFPTYFVQAASSRRNLFMQ
ncbi:MAG: 4-(cytidine 5'-diphospho)-2-C-methyl-D-erythritol kinase [Alphaproteobacteria bacterium]